MVDLTLLAQVYEYLKTIVLSAELAENDSFLRLILKVLNEAQKHDNPAFSLTLLPVYTCIAVGGTDTDALVATAAWRALHLAAKWLDDVEDGDDIVLAGELISPGIAVNLATGLIALANSVLARHTFSQSDAESLRRDLLETFNRTILQMGAGQHLDIAREGFLEIDLYRKVMAAKSGRFFQLAAWSGARCAADDQNILSLMASFGYNLGMMLQLNDDLRDFRKVGPGGDLVSGQATYPIYYALSVASAAEQKRLRHLLSLAVTDARAEREARSMIRALGGEIYMMAEIMRYQQRASAALDELKLSPALRGILEAWLERLSLVPAQLNSPNT